MKNYLKISRLVSISMALIVLVFFISCDSEPVEERMDLPPMESMVMEFSDFSEQAGIKKGAETTNENFLHSYVSVVYWNLASTIAMAIPVVAYGHALQQEPEYLGDNTWEWSFDFELNGVSYTATLTGSRINNEEFSMEMVIALAALPGVGMKWFDGVARYDHTHVTWNLFKEGTIEVLETEWHKDYETNAADLRYTYVEPEQDETGSYIMFKYMPEEVYDASYTISLTSGTTEIQWNTITKEGRVLDQVKFGKAEWHCWDSKANGLVDRVCD